MVEESTLEAVPSIVHPSWHECMTPLMQLESVKKLKYEILTKTKFYPAPENVFNAFRQPLESIRVVIIAQDPYSAPKQATGYAFAVNEGVKIPVSLEKILAESGSTDRTLRPWIDQGVLLLNAALTVEAGNPNSHTKYWLPFINGVVDYISKHTEFCIWMLWGSKAASFTPFIHDMMLVNDFPEAQTKNIVLFAPHPAAGSYGNPKKFEGCNHFRIANEVFNKKGLTLINW
jgi:uracil-DNA glycosylase